MARYIDRDIALQIIDSYTVTGNGEYDPNDIVCGYHMSDGFDSDDYCSYGKRGKST